MRFSLSTSLGIIQQHVLASSWFNVWNSTNSSQRFYLYDDQTAKSSWEDLDVMSEVLIDSIYGCGKIHHYLLKSDPEPGPTLLHYAYRQCNRCRKSISLIGNEIAGAQRIPHHVPEPYGRSEKRVSELSTELLDEDMSSICRQRVMKCLGRWSSRFPALIPLAELLDAMQLLAGRFQLDDFHWLYCWKRIVTGQHIIMQGDSAKRYC